MKKRVMCLTFSILLVFLAVSSVVLASDKVTINYAGIKFYTSGAMPRLIAQFEKENPDIDVNYIELPSPNNSTAVHQYLVTNLASGGTTIDVFTADGIWFPEFAEAGWLLDLDKYFTDEYLSDYFKGALKTVSYQGDLVGLPWHMDGGFLYYRKDLLDKYGFRPPQTWQELITQAKLITQKENNPELKGFIWQAKQAEILVCDFVEFLGSDGKILDDKGNIYITDQYARRALKLMHDLIYKNNVSPQSVTTYDEEPSRNVFTSGNAVFLRNWSYVWEVSQDKSQSKVVGKVGFEPMPAFKGSTSASTLGGYQYGINKNTKHPEAAVKLLKFLSSPASQKYFADEINLSPTRKSVYNDPVFKEKHPFFVNLKQIYTHATPRPISPYYPKVSLVLQKEISSYLTNNQDLDKTVKNIKQQIQYYYNK